MINTPSQQREPHYDLDAMAEHIEKLSRAADALKTSRLREKTILVLLKDMTGMAQRDIKLVLDALPLLERHYLKPPVAAPGKSKA
jgi:hypothetical protein